MDNDANAEHDVDVDNDRTNPRCAQSSGAHAGRGAGNLRRASDEEDNGQTRGTWGGEHNDLTNERERDRAPNAASPQNEERGIPATQRRASRTPGRPDHDD